jgi:asparagine synthase (glutamine-hydrolysing)
MGERINGNPRLWGIVSFGGQGEDQRKLLSAELRERSDVTWKAGSNWCLVCENQAGHDLSLACDEQSGLHAAVAGKAWPLDKRAKEDAALAAELYQSYGDGLINQSDGQFSAVIVDEAKRRATLTVNWPGGYHRLYYCIDRDRLCFASRLDVLIHRCGGQAEVNEQAVVDLFCFGGLASDVSMVKGVHRVVPGSAVVYENGHIRKPGVYQYPISQEAERSDEDELIRLHREAVGKRIRGHEDFGVFLSGGLDSSMNVAAAAHLSSKPVKTFTVAYNCDRFDESSYARMVASRHNTEHCELNLETEGCLERLAEMVWAMQEPISDYSYIPTFYIAEAIKKHVDLAIGGDGPDHLLGRSYGRAAWYDLAARIPLAFSAISWIVRDSENGAKSRQVLWKHARRRRPGRQLWQSLACATNPCGSGSLSRFQNVLWGDLAPSDLISLLSPDFVRRCHVSTYNSGWVAGVKQYPAGNTQDRFILADTSLSGMTGVFAKTGAMCSAHNLIIREPYLAAPLVRYFLMLGNKDKVDGSRLRRISYRVPTSKTKLALRQAAMNLVPEEIILHKRKHGFEFPLVDCWKQATRRAGAEQIFAAVLSETDWFNRDFLDRLLQEQAAGARNHRYLLLLVAAVDQWFRIFVKGNAQPPRWRWSDCFGTL